MKEQQQICSKCKQNLTMDKFSNPTKEKRCRECLKSAKNSLNKKDPILDTEPTDLNNNGWQGGKYAGTVSENLDKSRQICLDFL